MKHVPRKRFGQNFLTDAGVLIDIVDAIAPRSGDAMVEIGPGLGAMTHLLLAALDQLHVVELDRDLALRLRQKKNPRLIVHEADALQFDFASLPVGQNGKLRIVGNLPYNISTPLLFHLARYADRVKDQHFMLQKEVVQRMTAEAGGTAYGRLTVMLQRLYDMELLFVVPPQAFDPPPRVGSAIVRMQPRENPPACDEAALEEVVAKAFSQRRKVIRNCMAGMFDENELADAGIDPQLRPEAIPLDGYVALADLLAAKRRT